MRKVTAYVIVLFIGTVSSSAYSSNDDDTEHGSGDWFAETGIEASFTVTGLYQRNVKGGLSTNERKGEFTGTYEPELLLNMQELLGIDGQFYIHGKGGWSDTEGIDAVTAGSYGGVNAVAGGNRTLDVVEAFYQARPVEWLEITAGKLDMTGFFDASEYANDETTQFLNGSLVNNLTIPFPDYGLAVIASCDITDRWSVTVGAGDAQADGRESGFNTAFHGEDYFIYMAETGLRSAVASPCGELGGNYRLGIWYDPQPKSNSDDVAYRRDDIGLYASLDQMLWKENSDADDAQGLGAFFRYGYADGRKNDVRHFLSYGFQYLGLLDGRDADVAGIGYGNIAFSDDAKTTYPDGDESVCEAYYSIALHDNAALTLDAQYVAGAGGSATKDAIVTGVRLQLAF